MINIAFQGGTHGNFLRYFLDRFSSLTPEILEEPFTETGATHKKIKYSGRFSRYHPNIDSPYFKNIDQQHILITVDNNDLLFLQRIIHKRTGDFNVDLTKNTIKLPADYIKDYNTNPRFYALYNKEINETTEIPKYIFRDFLKLSFLNPLQDGFIEKQNKYYIKELPKKTLFFPVSAFWNKDIFFKEISTLDKKLNLQLVLGKDSEDIFTTFQNKIEQLPTQFRCQEIIECLKNKKEYDLSQIDTAEQAYLSSYIEQNYQFITVPNTNYFFQNTKEILDWIEWYPQHYKAMNPNLPTFKGIPNPFHLWNQKK
jgi:hypothetical protein